MDFGLTTREREVLDQARAIMTRDVYPLEGLLLERKSFKAILPELSAAREAVRQVGLFAPQLGKAHGGAGLSLTEHARLSEILGRSPLGHYVFGCQAPDAGNMEILALYGTPAQKEQWLAPLAAGKLRSCFSMTEPDLPGSNPTWLGTTATLDGEHWVVRGRKWFTTAADGAAFAIVMAVTEPDAAPHARASMIIVPTDTPGFRLVRNISVMGEAGEDWASHAEVHYDGCRVPKESILGERGAGFFIAQERLGPGRIHHAMRWLGIAERAFEMMCSRAAKREIAPGKMLGEKQIIQTWIAESRAEIDAARVYVLHTAWRIETEGQHEARDAVSGIKFFVADVLSRVLDRAVQTHGALGVTDDTILAWFYRHERAAHIYDGADEVHKASLAKRILRGYGVRA